MPLKFWDQAFLTATYLINILPSKVLDNKTPVELLLNEKPHYNSLRVFGCACWPNLRPYNTRKLAFRSTQCVFLGYNSLHKGFKCLEPNTGRIYISQDVVFDENVFPFSSLRPNAGARLRNEISLLSENLTPCVPGDVGCHVPNATNPTASSNLREVQEQEEVQEIQEIMDEEATDPAAAPDPSTSPGGDSPTSATAPTESVYEAPDANPGSPRGGQDRLRDPRLFLHARRQRDLLWRPLDPVWIHLASRCQQMRPRPLILRSRGHTHVFRAASSSLRYTQTAQ